MHSLISGTSKSDTLRYAHSKPLTLGSLHLHVIFLDLWMTGEELLYWTDIIRETFTTPSNPIKLERLGRNTLILSTWKTPFTPTLQYLSSRLLRSTSIQGLRLHTFSAPPEWSADLLQMTLCQELLRLRLTWQTSQPMNISSLERLRPLFCMLSMIWTLSPTRLTTIIGTVLRQASTLIDPSTEMIMRWMLSSICSLTYQNPQKLSYPTTRNQSLGCFGEKKTTSGLGALVCE